MRPEESIDDRETEHHESARQNKKAASEKAAAHAGQTPSKIGRELLRFGARQKHAEIKRMEKRALINQTSLFNKLTVQQSDLRGRSPKGKTPDLEPRLRQSAFLDTDTEIFITLYHINTMRLRSNRTFDARNIAKL